MRFVFFCHPAFMASQSMPRFARMLGAWVASRGHEVTYWQPGSHCHDLARRLGWRAFATKWAGYIDQYLIFPWQVRWRLRHQPSDTLFVFCDQALGPWVPLVKHRPHVIHAHDLLALRSALGLIPENPVSLTGRLYQRYIRQGFRQGRNFICVSQRTRDDLQRFGGVAGAAMQVVYNGLNHPYKRVPAPAARAALRKAGLPDVEDGLLLHVGGGQWYKNTAGVIRLYGAYARRVSTALPLWMISPLPTSQAVEDALRDLPAHAQVRFFQGIDNAALEALYSLSAVMLFPSLAEGFGWPLVEAQASGCAVLTSDDSPMNEVAGPHAHYLPVLKPDTDANAWAEQGGALLVQLTLDPDHMGTEALAQRMAWAARFTATQAMEGYWSAYLAVLAREVGGLPEGAGSAA